MKASSQPSRVGVKPPPLPSKQLSLKFCPSAVNVWRFLIPYGILIVWVSCLFLPALSVIATRYLGSGACDMNIAYRHFLAFGVEWLRRGVVPQWNPHIFCGTVFLPSTCATLYHPLNSLLLISLPLPLAANMALLAHVTILGGGMFAWARRLGLGQGGGLFAALLATCSSVVASRLFAGHFTIMTSFAWAPAFFAVLESMRGGDRSAWLACAVIGSFIVLGGHLQIAYYTFLLGAMIVACDVISAATSSTDNKPRGTFVWRYLLAVLFSLGLAGVELVPVLDTLRDSARVLSPDSSWIRRFSFPLENLATLLFPNLWGGPLEYCGRWFWWEVSPYAGLVALTLASNVLPLSRAERERFRPVMVLGVSSFLLALSPDLPVLGQVSRLIPGWSALRGHAKIFMFAMLTLPLWAAWGLQRAGTRLESRRWGMRLVASICLAVIGAAMASGIFDSLLLAAVRSPVVLSDRLFGPDPTSSEGRAIIVRNVHRAGLHALAGGFAAILIIVCLRRWPSRRTKLLAAGLALLDVAWVTLPIANTTFVAPCERPLEEIRAKLQKDGAPGRIEVPPQGLVNAAMSARLYTPGGNDINISRAYDTFLSAIDGRAPGEPHLHVRVEGEHPLWDVAALCYIAVARDAQLREKLPLEHAFDTSAYVVWRRPSALPLAFVVKRAKTVENDEGAIYRALSSNAIDFRREVLLVGEAMADETNGPAEMYRPAELWRTGLHELRVADAPAGYLVIAESYSRHWRAFDKRGALLPVYRANGAFLAVRVREAGEVTLRYENPAFFWGRLLTLVSALCALTCWWLFRRRSWLRPF